MADEGTSPTARWRAIAEEHTRRLIDDGRIALHDVEGEEYFHRPGEVIVAIDRLEILSADLADLGGAEPQIHEDVGSATVALPVEHDLHAVVSDLRSKHQIGADALAPHHVMFGTPKRAGCPGRPAHPGPPVDLVHGEAGSGVLIALIDTGLAEEAIQIDWVNQQVTIGGGIDLEVLDADGDTFLDFEAGHGTFIAGLIAQTAPGARVRAIRALDSDGVTDDLRAARAVLQAVEEGAQIINLSFGGYCFGDEGPLALQRVLADQPGVVVAAAGNDGVDRPFFPAAHPGVIGVAALGATGRRAPFSNFGDWVQACADGDRLLSIFVRGIERDITRAGGQRTSFSDPFAYWSGTSFAAPQVAAALAVRMWETGESGQQAAQGLILDGALSRRGGLGVRITTQVRSNPASVESP
ncbi:MAG: hypothetical protein QOJ92_2220 [Frankiales bacterium]|nr:hypothetical protein [Frankiales bacterium]